jgi:hypothetical protein
MHSSWLNQSRLRDETGKNTVFSKFIFIWDFRPLFNPETYPNNGVEVFQGIQCRNKAKGAASSSALGDVIVCTLCTPCTFKFVPPT